MDYQEAEPPAHLASLVKAEWTLCLDGTTGRWVSREASPDGCIEIIHRYQGRSRWRRLQPQLFVGGLIENAAQLEMSDDACFSGLRLWPWTWNAFFAPHSSSFIDDWTEMNADIAKRFASEGPGAVYRLAEEALCGTDLAHMGELILASMSISELASRSGKSMRWLQRWFERHVGIPPKRFFRMLRFQNVMRGLQRDASNLAYHAADHGFADQAHMAREFRSFIRASAQRTRPSAKGPFFDRKGDD